MKTYTIYTDAKEDRFIMVTTICSYIDAVNYHQGISEGVIMEYLTPYDKEITELYKTHLKINKSLTPSEIMNKILHGTLNN